MPVVVLHGQEEFLVARRAFEIAKQKLEPGWEAVNLTRLKSPDTTEIIYAAHGLPLGPGNRVVVIEGCSLFAKGRSADTKSVPLSQAQLEELAAALERISAVTWLIFALPYRVDNTLKASRVLSKFADFEEFPGYRYFPGSRNAALETWVRLEAKRAGATIDDDAITYLLESTESNLRQLSLEIEKAAVYLLPERHIDLKTVAALSEHRSQVFALLDSWAAGNREKALRCLDELLSWQSGAPVMAALQTVLSRWLEVKSQAEAITRSLPVVSGSGCRQPPAKDLARRVAEATGMRPFLVELDLARTGRLETDWLLGKRIELTELESQVKSGLISDGQALTLFLTS